MLLIATEGCLEGPSGRPLVGSGASEFYFKWLPLVRLLTESAEIRVDRRAGEHMGILLPLGLLGNHILYSKRPRWDGNEITQCEWIRNNSRTLLPYLISN